jgi:hypothetical protein
VPTEARAKSVEFADDEIRVRLTDGRTISAPLQWFPSLVKATTEQRARCEISGGGRGLHWPDLDEDLSVAGLLAGADVQAW